MSYDDSQLQAILRRCLGCGQLRYFTSAATHCGACRPLATAASNKLVPLCPNCEAMRRAAKVFPRPWMDGGVTWKDWDAACEVLWPRF